MRKVKVGVYFWKWTKPRSNRSGKEEMLTYMKPCPFCGGKAILNRELNLDELVVSHKTGCIIGNNGDPPKATRYVIIHYQENRPFHPFKEWNKRARITRKVK